MSDWIVRRYPAESADVRWAVMFIDSEWHIEMRPSRDGRVWAVTLNHIDDHPTDMPRHYTRITAESIDSAQDFAEAWASEKIRESA